MRKKTAQNTHASQSKFSTRSRTLTAKNITQPLSSVTIPQRREGRQTSQESLFLRTLGANETDFYTCSSTEFLHTEKLHDLVLLEEINKIFMEGKQTLTAYTGKLPFRHDAFSIQGSRAAQVPSSNPRNPRLVVTCGDSLAQPPVGSRTLVTSEFLNSADEWQFLNLSDKTERTKQEQKGRR